jgi:hypothetical protein
MALSMTEAEYIALTQAAKELIWLHKLLIDLGFDITNDPTSMRSDNLGAISLACDSTFHACTKHIKIAYHFICEQVASNKATLTYVQSKENLVDIMTKGLDKGQHNCLKKKLGFL